MWNLYDLEELEGTSGIGTGTGDETAAAFVDSHLEDFFSHSDWGYMDFELKHNLELLDILTANSLEQNLDADSKACDKEKNCPTCGKTVRQMRKHMLIHSGQKPYKCKECGKNFSQKSNLNRHHRSVHEVFYLHCDKCSFLSKRRDKLKVHRKKCVAGA